jgi:hypothetical protein
MFNGKQFLKILYTVEGKNEALDVDTTIIHKLVYKLVTLHQQLNRSMNFHEIRYKNC